mgnify:CR=1 FL=1
MDGKTEQVVPNFLCHYYEAELGPFLNLSDLPIREAEEIQERIRREGRVFASKRSPDYLKIRRELEDRVRRMFIEKGGKPQRERPHYLVVGECPWLLTWYKCGQELRVPIDLFSGDIVSFTYGDLFPTMRYLDGKPYRCQVYTLSELPDLIKTYGLPQEWNRDGRHGPERYIEAQLWSDKPIAGYLRRLPSRTQL